MNLRQLFLIVPILFLSSITAYANSFSKKAQDSLLKQANQNSFICYKGRSNARLESPVISDDGLEQNFYLDGEYYTLEFKLKENMKTKVDITLSQDYKVISQTTQNLTPLNFRKPNLKLNTNNNEINKIECFIGMKSFFINVQGLSSISDLVLHTHVEEKYFTLFRNIPEWYSGYASSLHGNHYVLAHGPVNDFKTYEINDKINEYKDKDKLSRVKFVTGDLGNKVSFKNAPTGNIHISLPGNFSQDIYILGLSYNYCVTDLLLSISRTMVSKGIKYLNVRLPRFYNFFQKVGINENLNVTGLGVFQNLDVLLQNEEKLKDLIKAQENYINKELGGKGMKIELLLNGQKSEKNLPRINIDIF